jgi:hypothetical protein
MARVLAVILVFASLFAASFSDVSADHKPDHQPQGQSQGGGNGGDNEKVLICHTTGNGSFHLIEVSQSAVDAHLAHGDVMPGDGGSCPVAETPPIGGDAVQPDNDTGTNNSGDRNAGGKAGTDDKSGNPNQDDAADPCDQPSACGEIAIFKFMCEEIGSRNTCNGRVTSLAGYDVDFSVEAADVPGNSAEVPDGLETITVTLGLNANENGNTGNGSQGREVAGPYPLGTYLVCEVPVAYNADGDEVDLVGEARPTAGDGGSTGGSRQEAIDPDGEGQGTDCIQVELTPGRAELKFVDTIAPETTGGEVDNETGGNNGSEEGEAPDAVGGVSEEPSAGDDNPNAVGGVSTDEDAQSDADLASVTALPATGSGPQASINPSWTALLLALIAIGFTGFAIGFRRKEV